MNNEIGDGLREAFLDLLKTSGTDYDVAGAQRRALKQGKKKEGYVCLQFADEFPIEVGDRVREARSEIHFDVVDSEPVWGANTFLYFEVTTERVS
jgi:hypothetical protein